MGYRGNTYYTELQNSDATAHNGRELYHLQFSLQEASPETFGYAIVQCILNYITALSYVLDDRWFESQRELKIFLFTTVSIPAFEPTQPPIQGTRGSFPGYKATGA
jgi:hypothetical protein